ncbi:hypothetical protein EDC04DRAFT_2615697 [Pisolithus marmoratus]|nr:hypothetical protein EDC04DRAFT_2615697 [Pisolithus marmoratus]
MSSVQNELPTPPLKSRGRLQRQGKDMQTLNLMPISAYYRDFTGIEGDIKNATTLTGQIIQSKGQPQFTLPVRTAPGTSSNSASAAPLVSSFSDARKLLCIVRKGKTLPLWEIEQIQIQYGVFQDIPWGILGFRLVKGKDAKDCVKVQVAGTIQSKGAEIKLNKEHIPVVLEVTANVVYRVFLLKQVVQGREVCVYSGEEKEDIRRGIVTTA